MNRFGTKVALYSALSLAFTAQFIPARNELRLNEVQGITDTEYVAEKCEESETLEEFGHGDFEACYWNLLEERIMAHHESNERQQVRSTAGDVRLVPPISLERYEDGSGVLYEGDREVATFPEDTFTWDCHTQGNMKCGPTS